MPDRRYLRLLLRRLAAALGGVSAVVQKAMTCFIPLLAEVEIALRVSLFAAAEACPRALPIAAFAALSHMLIKGFFIILPGLLPTQLIVQKICCKVLPLLSQSAAAQLQAPCQADEIRKSLAYAWS